MENNNLEPLFAYVPSERIKKQRDRARKYASRVDFKGFVLHHRLEEQGYTMEQLKKEGLYYNRPASELIFLTHKQHGHIHKTIRERCPGFVTVHN